MANFELVSCLFFLLLTCTVMIHVFHLAFHVTATLLIYHHCCQRVETQRHNYSTNISGWCQDGVMSLMNCSITSLTLLVMFLINGNWREVLIWATTEDSATEAAWFWARSPDMSPAGQMISRVLFGIDWTHHNNCWTDIYGHATVRFTFLLKALTVLIVELPCLKSEASGLNMHSV